MSRFQLPKATFTIAFRNEGADRQFNLTIVLDYLCKYLNTNIIIIESGPECTLQQFWKKSWNRQCKPVFVKEDKDQFHKTRLLNIGAMMCKTPILVSYDADILFSPKKYKEAYNMILLGKYNFCYPFNQNIVQIAKHKRDTFISKKYQLNKIGLEQVISDAFNRKLLLSDGGCLFMRKSSFMKIGMENEKFLNYNYEDAERRARASIMGHVIKRLPGHIYHLEHSRTLTSCWENPQYKIGKEEYSKIRVMKQAELKEYIKTWWWKKRKI